MGLLLEYVLCLASKSKHVEQTLSFSVNHSIYGISVLQCFFECAKVNIPSRSKRIHFLFTSLVIYFASHLKESGILL